MNIPVIGFSGYSGTGKTTLLEKIIPILKAGGLRVGVIKHDGHGFEIDRPGKDTYRFVQAGADRVLITSPDKTVQMIQNAMDLEACIGMISDVDLILVEGFKHASVPRIGIYRTTAGTSLPETAENYMAIVTDEALHGMSIPCFSLEDVQGVAEFIMKEAEKMRSDFTHFNDQGRARMVDVGDKDQTKRTAAAAGRVLVNEETFRLIQSGGMKKGDVLTVAQIAGIMAAKHTPDWIPMCHPVPLNGIDLRLSLDESRRSVEIEAEASCVGKTGVEMEVLTAVSCAALTVYDMCKAVQKDMVIADIRLLKKTGGIHGDYVIEEQNDE